MGIEVGRFTLNVYGIILSQGVGMSSNEVRNVSIIKQCGVWWSGGDMVLMCSVPNCDSAVRK